MGILRQPKLDADGEAFAALYRRHFGLVWSMTLHLGVPPAAREDVAQEVWLAIHRRLQSLRPDASSRAWVASIARNVALHHHRTDGRRTRKHSALTVVTDICERAHKTDALAEIDVALRQMDPAQREAFILVAVEELSGPEAAAVLGVPVNTVYSRLRLARARLATVLTEMDDEQAASALKAAPQQQAANRVWLALAIEFGWRDAAPTALVASSWTGKLAVVATSALATVIGTAALGGRGDGSAHARAPIEVREAQQSDGGETAPPEIAAPPITVAAASEPIARDEIASAAIAPAPKIVKRQPASRRTTPKAEPRTPVAAPEPAVEPAAPPPPETLAAEAKLLGLARRALSDEDPARARALLERHASEFPNGELALDRRAAWVRMLCASNEPARARHQLAKLMREHPTAGAVVAVRDVCKSE